MTLRRLGPDQGGGERRRPPHPSTAIAFAFDRDYVEPFRVLIYSMLRVGTLLDAPIYVYSDDAAVFDDPTVSLVADRRILIDGADMQELADVAEHHIQRAERAKWNRGTCLKWAVFDEAPVDQVLFLDVDMLCLRPLEGLLSLYPNSALVCCPQFQRSMVPPEGGHAAQAELRERLLELIGRRSRYMGRINSGVMLVRKPLLDRKCRASLIEFARTRSDVNEQSHLTKFFRDAGAGGRYRLKMASSSYNFQENYLPLLDGVDALQMLRRIRLLHYAGSQKPWRGKGRKQTRPTMEIWRQFRDAAEAGAAGPDAKPLAGNDED